MSPTYRVIAMSVNAICIAGLLYLGDTISPAVASVQLTSPVISTYAGVGLLQTPHVGGREDLAGRDQRRERRGGHVLDV